MSTDEALSELIRVAAELVLCAEIDDPELPEFKPLGRAAVKELVSVNCRRAKRIVIAAAAIEKARTS